MAWRTPLSLTNFCQKTLPLLDHHVKEDRIMEAVATIIETDQWNSFNRFHDTTKTLVRYYQEAGVDVEVASLPTGGEMGSGRWIIHQAADINKATVDIINPVGQRLLDYQDNPWHLIQWSGSTPAAGIESKIVIIDSRKELDRISAKGLVGKMVLTDLNPRHHLQKLIDTGAVGVITDRPIPNLPDAIGWTKFGWGGIPIGVTGNQQDFVGLVISKTQGAELRQLLKEHGKVVVRTQVDIDRYHGSHDVVSGIIRGADDPQDELWVLAHSAEPGAHDNASGVALCVEIARIMAELIAQKLLPRPKRSIRLLSAYECYGFFKYLEDTRYLQTPLAGVVVDTIGSKSEVCDGRLEWHATIPMSAGFVDRVGEAIIHATLNLSSPGYQLYLEPFVSTSDTLIGDPKYGFPAPWLTTHHQDQNIGFDAYHSSADTINLIDPKGLVTCVTAIAGYLYYLADAGSQEVIELATAETDRTISQLRKSPQRLKAKVDYICHGHRETINRLKRWMWGGDRKEILVHLDNCQHQVQEAASSIMSRPVTFRKARTQKGEINNQVYPHRTAVLSPDWGNNTNSEIRLKMEKSRLKPWALFWADSNRSLEEIADALSVEYGKKVTLRQVTNFFEAHQELGYVKLIKAKDRISKSQLVTNLHQLGLESGMNLMVHSSLSQIGYPIGGANMVVEALLEVIGDQGTLMMPSFNHRSAEIFNPMTTPTINGAIPEAMWRRMEAVRSLHPTHAVTAIGPKAAEYCEGHLEIGIWAEDSPIGRLIHGGGYILSLGVTHESSTAYHVAEVSMPCGCIDPFGNIDRVVTSDGTVAEVKGLAFRAGVCPVSPAELDTALNNLGLQRLGKVGKADAALVKASDLWEIRRQHLKDACPNCTIQPSIRK